MELFGVLIHYSTLQEFSLPPGRKNEIVFANVQVQHRIFRLQLEICQIRFLVLIKLSGFLRVLGSISSYKHDNLLYGNSVRTL